MWSIVRPDAVSVVNDKQLRRSLARYFDVMENKKLAKFVIAKRLSASYDRKDSTEKLWQLHENLAREYLILERKIDTKLTYPKIWKRIDLF